MNRPRSRRTVRRSSGPCPVRQPKEANAPMQPMGSTISINVPTSRRRSPSTPTSSASQRSDRPTSGSRRVARRGHRRQQVHLIDTPAPPTGSALRHAGGDLPATVAGCAGGVSHRPVPGRRAQAFLDPSGTVELYAGPHRERAVDGAPAGRGVGTSLKDGPCAAFETSGTTRWSPTSRAGTWSSPATEGGCRARCLSASRPAAHRDECAPPPSCRGDQPVRVDARRSATSASAPPRSSAVVPRPRPRARGGRDHRPSAPPLPNGMGRVKLPCPGRARRRRDLPELEHGHETAELAKAETRSDVVGRAHSGAMACTPPSTWTSPVVEPVRAGPPRRATGSGSSTSQPSGAWRVHTVRSRRTRGCAGRRGADGPAATRFTRMSAGPSLGPGSRRLQRRLGHPIQS